MKLIKKCGWLALPVVVLPFWIVRYNGVPLLLYPLKWFLPRFYSAGYETGTNSFSIGLK